MFDTRPTPGMRRNRSSTFSVAKLLRYTSSNLASDDVMQMVNNWLGDCFSIEMPFFTTSAGKRDSAILTRFCISTAARSGLEDMSNVTVAENDPELELVLSI